MHFSRFPHPQPFLVILSTNNQFYYAGLRECSSTENYPQQIKTIPYGSPIHCKTSETLTAQFVLMCHLSCRLGYLPAYGILCPSVTNSTQKIPCRVLFISRFLVVLSVFVFREDSKPQIDFS